MGTECTASASLGLVLQQDTAMPQSHSSPLISSTREIHGDVHEGPVILFMLLLSWDVDLMNEIWVVKEVGCQS